MPDGSGYFLLLIVIAGVDAPDAGLPSSLTAFHWIPV
jgi:hypothetical protein